jgi:glucose/arabinose dehydrogenase
MAFDNRRFGWLTPIAGAAVIVAWAHGCGGDETRPPSSGTLTTTSSSGGGADTTTTTTTGSTTGAGGAGGLGGGGAGGMTPQAPTNADCSPATGALPALKLTEVTTGFTNPILVTAPWGDDERLFIVEQGGQITLRKNGSESTFLDIDPLTNGSGERGLLGLAFHPDYANNGRFFVHYTDNGGDNVIAEYRRDPVNPDLADGTAVATVLTETQPDSNHNGGMIAFSPFDGMLYIGFGDGGGSDDAYNHGQTVSSRLAALLRIDVSTTPYSIPTGNLVGGGAAPEIWDYGLRNPWRFSFDICGGDLYIGDVGQDCYEEVDVAAAGDGNKNWGWPLTEAQHCFNAPDHNVCDLVPPGDCTTTGTELSTVEYAQAMGRCSVTGGYVYRGAAIPALRGAYLYADYCTGEIWSFRWNAGTVSDQQDLSSDLWQGLGQGPVSSFGQDNAGELYVVAYGAGTIYRIDPE